MSNVLTFNPITRQSSRRQNPDDQHAAQPAVRRRPNPFNPDNEDPGGYYACEWLAAYHHAEKAGASRAKAIAAANKAVPPRLCAPKRAAN